MRHSDSTFRFIQEQDIPALKEIFVAQNLPVYLPVPGEDPSVAVAVIEEVRGQLVKALILRSTLEAHYVTGEPDAHALNRMLSLAEGAVMQLNVDLARLKFPLYTDGRARVSRTMPEMIEFMRTRLNFIPETDQFVGLVKPLGK